MFQYLRKAVTTNIKDTRSTIVQDEYHKKKLKDYLLLQIKNLQRAHVGSQNYFIDRHDQDAIGLCTALEAIFLHGLISSTISTISPSIKGMFSDGVTTEIPTLSFWDLVREVTHNDVLVQLQHLVVTTEVGFCRAWLRLAFNDGLITSYLDAILSDVLPLSLFYAPNAFLMDEDLPLIMKDLLQGVLHFEFHLNYNSSKLNKWELLPLQLAGCMPSDDLERRNTQTTINTNHSLEVSHQHTKQQLLNNKLINDDSNESSSDDINSKMLQQILRKSSSIERDVYLSGFNSSASDESIAEEVCTENSEINEGWHEEIFIGNRLDGNGWSGWSSSFETKEHDEVDNIQTDFGSLLKSYGNKKHSLKIDPIPPVEFEELHIPIQSPVETDMNLRKLEFEVVPRSAIMQTEKSIQASMHQLTRIGNEVGLDQQNYSCKGCTKSIGLIYGAYRVCRFNGGYYCLECHQAEEYYLSSRIIHDWDFKKYSVSKYNKLFLMKIEEEPLFHMDELNPLLYDVIDALKEARFLRTQLQFIKGYIQTCRQDVNEDFRRRLWPRDYLCDDVHQYSLLDLVQVHNGQLAHNLKKIVNEFSKHIYKCNLCREKGFICEYCHDKTIIYPFQLNTAIQCPGCLSVFHKKCRQEKRCPKCVRIRLRTQSRRDERDECLNVAQTDYQGSNDIL